MKDYSNLQPLKTQVLLRQDPPKTQLGHIHLPDDTERPQEGTVIRLGNGPYPEDFEWEVMPEDRVLIERYGGTDLGDGLRIMPYTAMVGVLDTDEDGNELMIPLDDFVVARMMPPEEMTDGGMLFLADISKETQEFGIVVGCGDNVQHVKPEDRIYINKVQGMHYRVGGNDYIVIREPKVHLILEKNG